MPFKKDRKSSIQRRFSSYSESINVDNIHDVEVDTPTYRNNCGTAM